MRDTTPFDPLSTPGMLLTALGDLLEALDAQFGPLDMDNAILRSPLDDARLLGLVAIRIAEPEYGGQMLQPWWADAAGDPRVLERLPPIPRAQILRTVEQVETWLHCLKTQLWETP